MQIFWLPQNICAFIDRTIRDFIWKGNNSKGLNLVNWDTVTKPKQFGGLGVRQARDSNTALLGKLVWAIQTQPNKLWVQLMQQKYIKDTNFLIETYRPGSYVWTSICKAKEVLKGGFKLWLGDGSSSF